MHEYEILKLLVLIFGVSALVIFLLHRVKVPPLVGFIISGVLIGPAGLGLAEDVKEIELLAEIGVALLLFVIGIEFSLKNLIKMKKAVLQGGSIQIFLTIFFSIAIIYPTLLLFKNSIFFGFLIALSSTAIVLKMLDEEGGINTPQGRTIVGILIFQDLMVVPFMLITPLLGGAGFDISALILKMAKAAAIVAFVLLAARWIVPGILHQVVHVRSKELFITTIILLCFGTAMLTSRFGLSLALGAFLAGLVISESEYAHQAMSDILPFKDSFIGFFFVSVGMLMDLTYIADNWPKVIAAVGIIIVIKVITGTSAALASGSSIRPALITGISLAQIGEFSFVLAESGRPVGLITGGYFQLFLSASLITMLFTPFLIKAAPAVSTWATTRLFDKRLRRFVRMTDGLPYEKERSGHVIIVGFGLNGKNLARVLRQVEIPYAVLEMNSDTVRKMEKKGEPIYYGDGTSSGILQKIGINTARMLVVAISDAASTRHIVQAARRENPELHIIVRTRYVSEVDDLKKLGANEVIPEEFETSIEIFSRVLDYYSLPKNVINDYIDNIRSDNYQVLRRIDLPRRHLSEHADILEGIDTESYLIREGSGIIGKTIQDSRLREETGVTILAIRRGEKIHQNPSPGFVLTAGDILALIGKREDLNRALRYLDEL